MDPRVAIAGAWGESTVRDRWNGADLARGFALPETAAFEEPADDEPSEEVIVEADDGPAGDSNRWGTPRHLGPLGPPLYVPGDEVIIIQRPPDVGDDGVDDGGGGGAGSADNKGSIRCNDCKTEVFKCACPGTGPDSDAMDCRVYEYRCLRGLPEGTDCLYTTARCIREGAGATLETCCPVDPTATVPPREPPSPPRRHVLGDSVQVGWR